MTEIDYEPKIEDRSEEEVTGYSRISCPCGFEVVGQDEGYNIAAFEAHACAYDSDERGDRWYHSVFSVWGVLIVIFVGYAAIQIFGGSS